MATSKNNRKPSIKAAIKQAKAAEATVTVCLRGDLVKAIEQLEQRKIEILAGGSDSLVPPDTSAVDKEIAELEERRDQVTFEFRLRELSYRRWDQLETAHPPRDGKWERVNAATFLPAVVRASVVEPKLDDEDWNDLLGVRFKHTGDCKLDTDTDNEACTCREPVLSKSQFGRLADTAVNLNSAKDAQVPFSVIASMIRQVSGSE